jgi:hypothetical protein
MGLGRWKASILQVTLLATLAFASGSPAMAGLFVTFDLTGTLEGDTSTPPHSFPTVTVEGTVTIETVDGEFVDANIALGSPDDLSFTDFFALEALGGETQLTLIDQAPYQAGSHLLVIGFPNPAYPNDVFKNYAGGDVALFFDFYTGGGEDGTGELTEVSETYGTVVPEPGSIILLFSVLAAAALEAGRKRLRRSRPSRSS